MNVIQGLLRDNTISNLKKLVYTDETSFVVEQIDYHCKGLKKYLWLLFLAQTLLNTALLVIVNFLNQIKLLEVHWYGTLALFVVVCMLLLFYSNYRLSVHQNSYRRLIKTLLDNILDIIVDNYRLSIAERLPSIPKFKNLMNELDLGGLALVNTALKSSTMISVLLATIVLIFISVVSNNRNSLALSIVYLLIFVFYVYLLYLGRKYLTLEKDFMLYSDQFDLAVKESQPLLLETSLSFYNKDYTEHLKKIVNTTIKINLSALFADTVYPILIMVIPLLYISNNFYLSLVLGTLYVIKILFSNNVIFSNLMQIKLAEERSAYLDDLLETIVSYKEILTPANYITLQEEYYSKLQTQHAPYCKNISGLSIFRLTYEVGRGGDTKVIHVPKLHIPAGKVSFLIGNSGMGKSVFGRVITLRYSEFKADSMCINTKDIRTYESLSLGISKLHMSGLRNIETNYRNAISLYIKHFNENNLLFDSVRSFNFLSLINAKKHFLENKDYYLGIHLEDFDDFTNIGNAFWDKLNLLSSSDFTWFFEQVKQCYRDLHKKEYSSISCIEKENIANITSDIPFDTLVKYIAFAFEYTAFVHLKNYIPEANMFFVDAILSEPPISQGQRRRILYALDVLLKGDIYVLDEAFSNLDIEVSKKNICRFSSICADA